MLFFYNMLEVEDSNHRHFDHQYKSHAIFIIIIKIIKIQVCGGYLGGMAPFHETTLFLWHWTRHQSLTLDLCQISRRFSKYWWVDTSNINHLGWSSHQISLFFFLFFLKNLFLFFVCVSPHFNCQVSPPSHIFF